MIYFIRVRTINLFKFFVSIHLLLSKDFRKQSQLSQRIVLKEGPNQIRDKQNRDNALIILEEHGSVMLITEGKKQIIRIKPNIFRKLRRCDSCVI